MRSDLERLVRIAEQADATIDGKMIFDIGDYDAKRAVVKLKAAVQNLTHALRTECLVPGQEGTASGADGRGQGMTAEGREGGSGAQPGTPEHESQRLYRIEAAARAVVRMVEGFDGYGECRNPVRGVRLKDQPEWVELYLAVVGRLYGRASTPRSETRARMEAGECATCGSRETLEQLRARGLTSCCMERDMKPVREAGDAG